MLSGKIALITGGSGAIGAAVCRTFAKAGADVAFTYFHNEAKAEELAAEMTRLDRQCRYEKIGAADGEAARSFCRQIENDLGEIDILVNNIGATQIMPFALMEDEDWDEMMEVNLKSMFIFSKAVVPAMIRKKAGVILNIGSIAGRRLLEVPVHYATAKAGVTGFTLSLAKEFSRYNIRVNELTPGLIQGGVGANINERQLEEFNRFCASGRPGTPEEVAEFACFLVSDKASYINAQSMVIDGGL